MATNADIVIIGAGVHGASAAFALAKAKAGKVVLLDKAGVACGPTAKSGAMIRPMFSEAPYIQLVSQSLDMFENWGDAVGGDAGYVGRGFFRITPSLETADVGGDLELMRRLGVQFEIVPTEVLADLAPDARFSGNEQGIWIRRAGFADPVKTTRSLAEAARREGAEVRLGIEITGLETRGGRISAVETGDGRINTGVVLNCAGPWAPRLAAMVGVELPIEAHRCPTCLFQRPETIKAAGPILSDGSNQVYLREMGDALLRAAHFGWTADRVDPDDYDETISNDQLKELRRAVAARYESFNNGVFAGGFSAIYDMTPDGHPIIGRMAEVEGFWCNCGWSGNGFASAPALGTHLAASIMGGDAGVDLGMFAWPRPPEVTARPDWRWVYR